MSEFLRKRRGPTVKEIEMLLEVKRKKAYKNFKNFIREHTDYAPSTIYTYIKLYQYFGKELENLGLSKARLLLKFNKLNEEYIEIAKSMTFKSLKEFLSRE